MNFLICFLDNILAPREYGWEGKFLSGGGEANLLGVTKELAALKYMPVLQKRS